MFCGIELVLCLSPGPSVLLVNSLSLTGARKSAGIATSGVLAANGIYFLVALLGLTTIINLSVEAFYIVKWAGAGYLTWVGLKIIYDSFSLAETERKSVSPTKALSQGFLTQAANPNLIFYFTAILPQFIDPTAHASSQMLILGVSSLLVEGLVLLLYAQIGDFVHRTGSPVARTWINRVGGGLLVGAAVMLSLAKRAQDEG